MRRLRLAALGMLLLASLIAGALPADASTVPSSLSWFVFSPSGPSDAVEVCADQAMQADEQLLMQQLVSGSTWRTVRTFTGTTLAGQECLRPTARSLVAGPGTYTFRAVLQDAAAHQLATAQTQVTVATAGVDPWTESDENSSTTAHSRSVTVHLDAAYGQPVKLQRYSGGAWRVVTLGKATRGTISLPVPALVGLATYRVVSYAGTWTRQEISPTFTMFQTDGVRYAGFIAQARRMMSAYCPNTPIYVDPPDVARGPAGGAVGMAHGLWGSFNGSNYLQTYIDLWSGLSGTELRHVALHECGHVVQFRANVEGRYEVNSAAADRTYPGVGVEGQADCMAYFFVRWKPALYYVRDCSSAQLTDAKRMWLAYGSKYHAPVYTWRGAAPALAAGGSASRPPAPQSWALSTRLEG